MRTSKMRFLLSLFVISLMLLSSNSNATAGTSENTFTNMTSSSLTSITPQAYTWYRERGEVDISPEGHIWSRVSIEGNSLKYGGLNIADHMTPEIEAIFVWAGFWTGQSDNPFDQNSQLNFRFETNDPGIAESAANAMIDFMSSTTQMSMEFRGSNGFDEERDGSWVQMTEVWFDGHTDWTSMTDLIEASVPRSIGGLAETVDVQASTHLSFHFWHEGSSSYGVSIGVDFNADAATRVGGHSYVLDELLHVDNFKVATGADDLWIHLRLPNATIPAVTIVNSTDVTVYWQYHPSPEAQNQYHAWSGDIHIRSGVHSAIGLTFDYTYIQESWLNVDKSNWSIDPRGRSHVNIAATGLERIALTETSLATAAIFDNVAFVDFRISNVNLATSSPSYRLHIGFYEFADHKLAYDAIMAEFSNFGIDFNANSSELNDQFVWHQWSNDTMMDVTRYYIGGDFTWDYATILSNTFGFDKSAFLVATDLSKFNIFNYQLYPDRWGLGPTMELIYDPYYTDINPSGIPVDFVRGIETTHDVDLYAPNPSGWSGALPWDPVYSEIARFDFSAPFSGLWENIVYGPTTNNGLYWDSWRWNDYRYSMNYFSYGVTVYSDDPRLTDNEYPPNDLGPVNDFNVSFSFNFLDDNADIDSPHIWDTRFRDNTYIDDGFDGSGWTSDFEGISFTGNQLMVVGIQDYAEGGTWYDGTDEYPKFPSSGIADVNATLFRTDAPVNHEKFLFPVVDFIYNTTWPGQSDVEAWTGSIDTTTMPDGEWEIWFDILDNADNFGTDGSRAITIDNYLDGSTDASEIDWTTSPVDGTAIRDIVDINFTIADDIGTYIAIVWVGFGGYIVEHYDIVNNGTHDIAYYSFQVDTLFQVENAPLTIMIETLDMDGFWTRSDRTYTVDNNPIGNPPVINVLNPADGSEFNASINNIIRFEAEVTDDWGLKYVKVFLNDGSTIKEYNLEYDENLKIYFLDQDISTWNPDEYDWYIEVEDVDENTHVVTSAVRTLTIVGDAPLIVDTDDPTLSVTSHSSGDTVTGDVTFEVEATDDVAVQQVVIILTDGSEKVMTEDAGVYSYTWDSATVVDDTYSIKFTAKDTTGNEASVTISITTDNGRTEDTPDLGLPGFELYLALMAIFITIPIIRKRRAL